MCAQLLRHVQLFVTPLNAALQALLSTGFPKQEYWGGLPFPSQGIFSRDWTHSLVSPALAGKFFTTSNNKHLIAVIFVLC